VKKALVTGGAGFIASHVVDALIERGYEVAIVDNLSTGYERNLNSKAKFYKMDIRDENLKDVFDKEKPELVNHHAAQMDVRKSVTDPIYDAQVNVLGSLNLLENCKRVGVKKIVYASTGGAVYGEPSPDIFPVDEKCDVDPLSQYGITKHVVEHYLSLYYKLYSLRYAVLRYPNVYGPRQDPHGEAGVVAIFTEQMLEGITPKIFGDGSKTRDYVFVGDIVKANMIAIDKGENDVFNLGWGREITDFEIFDAIRIALGLKIKPIYAEKRLGEIDRICLDASKAKKVLGWQPTVCLKEGIAKAVEYYRKKKTGSL